MDSLPAELPEKPMDVMVDDNSCEELILTVLGLSQTKDCLIMPKTIKKNIDLGGTHSNILWETEGVCL